jgi:hypothetical protein
MAEIPFWTPQSPEIHSRPGCNYLKEADMAGVGMKT